MTQIIDISPLVSVRIGVWPGDTPFSREVLMDMQAGDNLTLSTIRSTVHLGAHTDAPNHYQKEGSGIAARDLDYYYGLCQVIRVDLPRGERIMPHHIRDRITTQRVLLYTGSFPDPENFNTDFNALSPEVVDMLYQQSVRLIGIDTPSIDPFDDKVLLSHKAIAERDMAVLEGVVLEDVDPGEYTLVALPLKLEGCDASPVRAALVPRP
jgi:arylformamidase